MASQTSKPSGRSSSRWLFLAALAIIASVLVGWSAYWYVASRQTQSALAAWMQREAQSGRIWACPSPQIGGFPFTVEVSCTNAGFQGELFDRKVNGTLRTFRAAAPLFQPDAISAELEPPFVAKTRDGSVDLMAHWENLIFEFEGNPEALERAALIGQKLTLKGNVAGVDVANSSIGRFNTYVVRLPGRQDNAFEFLLALNDATLPALGDYISLSRPAALAVGGTITQANFSGGSIKDKIEQWRNAGGAINLSTARVASGDQKFEARGEIALDEEHRVRGELDAEFANMNALLQQFGFDPMLVTAGSFLSDVLSNSKSVKGELLGGGRLHLPVAFSGGWLLIGAIKTPVAIPPLY
jgi:hypothetical protein